MRNDGTVRDGRGGYLNGVLSIIALLLMVIALRVGADPVSEARADSRTPAPPNAAMQRVQMIRAMESIEERLASIEQSFGSKTIDVNVVNKPEVLIAE